MSATCIAFCAVAAMPEIMDILTDFLEFLNGRLLLSRCAAGASQALRLRVCVSLWLCVCTSASTCLGVCKGVRVYMDVSVEAFPRFHSLIVPSYTTCPSCALLAVATSCANTVTSSHAPHAPHNTLSSLTMSSTSTHPFSAAAAAVVLRPCTSAVLPLPAYPTPAPPRFSPRS